ncbi:MAG: ribulose-phosphate 3-epimerase [Balneolales bacterium]
MKFNLPLVAPSILAADYTHLKQDIQDTIKGGAEWIHCDVMDGHFVPIISSGPMIISAAKRSCNVLLDVHLMVYNPDQYITDFAKAGAGIISVHCEATPHIHRSIQLIKESGVEAGVAINPGTPLEMIEPVLDDVNLVVLMSVNPGFGGQKFIESTYKRLIDLKRMRDERNSTFLIEIDGGVTPENIEKISNAGADIIVAGTSVFKTDDITQRMRDLTHRARLGKSTLV